MHNATPPPPVIYNNTFSRFEVRMNQMYSNSNKSDKEYSTFSQSFLLVPIREQLH